MNAEATEARETIVETARRLFAEYAEAQQAAERANELLVAIRETCGKGPYTLPDGTVVTIAKRGDQLYLRRTPDRTIRI